MFIKKQMKSEQELLDLGCYSTLDGVVTNDGTEINMKEFDTVVELTEKVRGSYRYVDKLGVAYREEWLKDIE